MKKRKEDFTLQPLIALEFWRTATLVALRRRERQSANA